MQRLSFIWGAQVSRLVYASSFHTEAGCFSVTQIDSWIGIKAIVVAFLELRSTSACRYRRCWIAVSLEKQRERGYLRRLFARVNVFHVLECHKYAETLMSVVSAAARVSDDGSGSTERATPRGGVCRHSSMLRAPVTQSELVRPWVIL